MFSSDLLVYCSIPLCVHNSRSMLKCCTVSVCVCVLLYMLAGLLGTCAVGPSTINVVVGLPLLSNLVGMDEHDQDCHQTDEGHQYRRAQSCVDVRDKAPRGGDRQKCECLFLPQCTLFDFKGWEKGKSQWKSMKQRVRPAQRWPLEKTETY